MNPSQIHKFQRAKRKIDFERGTWSKKYLVVCTKYKEIADCVRTFENETLKNVFLCNSVTLLQNMRLSLTLCAFQVSFCDTFFPKKREAMTLWQSRHPEESKGVKEQLFIRCFLSAHETLFFVNCKLVVVSVISLYESCTCMSQPQLLLQFQGDNALRSRRLQMVKLECLHKGS